MKRSGLDYEEEYELLLELDEEIKESYVNNNKTDGTNKWRKTGI